MKKIAVLLAVELVLFMFVTGWLTVEAQETCVPLVVPHFYTELVYVNGELKVEPYHPDALMEAIGVLDVTSMLTTMHNDLGMEFVDRLRYVEDNGDVVNIFIFRRSVMTFPPTTPTPEGSGA